MAAALPTEQVTGVHGTERRKFPPFPLNTLELQKRASRYLRMPSEHTMKVSAMLCAMLYNSVRDKDER